MGEVSIDGETLRPEDVIAIANGQCTASLSESSRKMMSASRLAIERVLGSGEVVYGINTGFGALSSVRIGEGQLEELQVNLIRSHACGVGDRMEPEHVLMMMIIRANSLAKGVSGARPELVELMLSMVNARIAPVVPRIGSLGASGDLAPLSHMSLPLIGEGVCSVGDGDSWTTVPSNDALSEAGLSPIILQAKEGLSLINGTSQMCAYMVLALTNLENLLLASDCAVACSLEGIRGSHAPFDPRIHSSRPQFGQSISAARISGMLADSEIMASHADCDRVQDAYSFRCSPQVHGPVIELAREVRRILEIEINSATDNPLVFVEGEDSEIISGGNFHGQNLAMASDSIALACHELAAVSERRINQLLDPSWSGQKPFLANEEGLESGLMIIQYVAASLVSEMHLIANPATTSNVPVSMGKEDHASMGATGAFRSTTSTLYLSQVIANEMICACEALDRIEEAPGNGVETIREWVRKYVLPLNCDRSLTVECEALSSAMMNGEIGQLFG
ncbi:MAG: histidine ammonia-lyase [Candidatus Thalassarchaeaceae archaeon]|jgi:histidine ammonia-lyase|nr:histidine ammonia-lyase [Candidatus Thalassarchaeaceae archaeon]